MMWLVMHGYNVVTQNPRLKYTLLMAPRTEILY